MTTKYGQLYNTRVTPQGEPVPGRQQVANSASGYVFALDDWQRLERFLILGSDAPTYYASARKLTLENADVVGRCLAADTARAVSIIASVSAEGRAPRNDAALFALAIAAAHTDPMARKLAFDALPTVARTGEQLFQFVTYAQGLRGWGRGMRTAVGRWYTEKTVKELAYQAIKYWQRHDWTHRDLLRLAKPKPKSAAQDALFHWITKGDIDAAAVEGVALDGVVELGQVFAFEAARTAGMPELLKLIRDHRLTHEMLPTEALGEAAVWNALLDDMPMTAMIRNLGRMTANGALTVGNAATGLVVERLSQAERLRRARVHPLGVLVALNTYQSGKGAKGNLTWEPVPAIVDALDGAFYSAFGAVEPTGKRLMLALDVSGSMAIGEIAGMTGVTPRVGSAAMAMVTLAAEKSAHVVGFTSTTGKLLYVHNFRDPRLTGLTPLDISPRRRLDDVVRSISDIPFGATDCSLPMRHALEKGLEIDAFVIYTDNETWSGTMHPFQALRQYRERTGIKARLIVVGMTATGFTIADPTDAGMLDVVGFDTAAPNVMADFIRGGA